VGELRLWVAAEHVIPRELGDPERPIASCFSQCDFDFGIQPLDYAAEELLFGPAASNLKCNTSLL